MQKLPRVAVCLVHIVSKCAYQCSACREEESYGLTWLMLGLAGVLKLLPTAFGDSG